MREGQNNQRSIDFVEADLYPSDIDNMDSIYVALEGVDFPITRKKLIEQCGDEEIYWTEDNTITLAEVLQQLPQEEFSSVSDLSAAISNVSEDRFEEDRLLQRIADPNS